MMVQMIRTQKFMKKTNTNKSSPARRVTSSEVGRFQLKSSPTGGDQQVCVSLFGLPSSPQHQVMGGAATSTSILAKTSAASSNLAPPLNDLISHVESVLPKPDLFHGHAGSRGASNGKLRVVFPPKPATAEPDEALEDNLCESKDEPPQNEGD